MADLTPQDLQMGQSLKEIENLEDKSQSNIMGSELLEEYYDHALAEYRMQLMLLERQNLKRLKLARDMMAARNQESSELDGNGGVGPDAGKQAEGTTRPSLGGETQPAPSQLEDQKRDVGEFDAMYDAPIQ